MAIESAYYDFSNIQRGSNTCNVAISQQHTIVFTSITTVLFNRYYYYRSTEETCQFCIVTCIFKLTMTFKLLFYVHNYTETMKGTTLYLHIFLTERADIFS